METIMAKFFFYMVMMSMCVGIWTYVWDTLRLKFKRRLPKLDKPD
jgi:hypothetical protein